jgi:hypothetical protein
MEKDVKKKREPSKWQSFLKSCIPEQPKDAGMGQKVTACGAQYRELKEKHPDKLDEIIAMVKSKQK